ncbi:MAG: class I SAM-dependent methyltransferase [Cyanobacteria bacterium P01_F01_bin.143]
MEQNNSQALYKIVLEKIRQAPKFQLTFAEYMDLVLYHPQYGYYSSGAVGIGAKGDFFTAVSLGQDFGELLAKQLFQMWQNLDYPDNFSLVEMGAGNGELAKDIITYLQEYHPDFIEVANYTIIEKSPKLRQRQQQSLKEFSDINISWKSWEAIPDNELIGCCFSNELIDAFPVHQIVINNQKLQEVFVTEEVGKIIEKYDELSTARLREYFDLVEIDIAQPDYLQGYRTEINLKTLDWLETVAQKLQRGYLLTIDYGYQAAKYYHPQRSQGTLKCYYQHRHHNNPYVNLGQQDITSHIDFTALENYGTKLGLETVGFTKQAIFLMALGLSDRLQELSTGKYNIQEIFNRRDALHQLINPSGLGGFGVLIQGKNLAKEQYNLQGLKII